MTGGTLLLRRGLGVWPNCYEVVWAGAEGLGLLMAWGMIIRKGMGLD
jgi:hypothetical protein